MFVIKLVIECDTFICCRCFPFEENSYPKTLTLFSNFRVTLQPQKLNEIFLFSTLYSRLGNGVPMVTKLVLEIHALCNKNEIC